MKLALTPAGDLAVGTARGKLADGARLTALDHAMLALASDSAGAMANAPRFAPAPDEIPSAFAHLLHGMRSVGQDMAEGKRIAIHKGEALMRWRRSMFQRSDFDDRQKGLAFRLLSEREGHAAQGFSAYGIMESTLQSATLAASDARRDAGIWIEHALRDGMPRRLLADASGLRRRFPARHLWFPEADSRSKRDPQWRLATLAFTFGWDAIAEPEHWLLAAAFLDSEKWRRFGIPSADPEVRRRDRQWDEGFDHFCSAIAPAGFNLSASKHARLLGMAIEDGVPRLHELFMRRGWYPLKEWSLDPPPWLASHMPSASDSPPVDGAPPRPSAIHAPEIARLAMALRESQELAEATAGALDIASPHPNRL